MLDQLIGARILELRTARGLTATMLGERLNLTAEQVGRFEAGAYRLTSRELLELIRALDATLEDLLGGL